MSYTLHEISRPSGYRKKKKRLGRGKGSGKGTYSGRGLKGQRSRSGGRVGTARRSAFASLLVRTPKLPGFKRQSPEITVVNLSVLEKDFNDGDKVSQKILIASAAFVACVLILFGLGVYPVFQGVLADADDRDLSYEHAVNMARHGECLFYLKSKESIYICRVLRAEILNTRERSIAYITYSDNLGGRVIRGAPLKEWNDSCSFDVDATGGDQ